MRHLLLAFSILLVSGTTYAQVEADVQGGRRWAESETANETSGVQQHEFSFSARYKVLDSGFSIGPFASYQNFRDDDLGEGAEADNYELGLEAKYGYPVTSWVTPYAKARWVAYSRGTITSDTEDAEVEMDFRTDGVQLSLGAAFPIYAGLELTAEAGYGIQMLKINGGEIKRLTDDSGLVQLDDDARNLSPSRRNDFNSKSFTVGLNLNI